MINGGIRSDGRVRWGVWMGKGTSVKRVTQVYQGGLGMDQNPAYSERGI